MYCAGVDAGSRAIKVLLLARETLAVVGWKVCDQGVEQAELATRLLEELLAEKGIQRSEVVRTIATGYGRDALEFADTTVTEISCHARGVHHTYPAGRTIIDIGGQDSKLLRLAENGTVRDFVVNDRCAAGTGRFLEIVAERIGKGLNDLGELAAAAQEAATISSMCVVFAETEIVGLLASRQPLEKIAAGVQAAIASRIATMAGRRVVDPVAFTGGVALIPGMRAALEKALDRPVTVVPDPQLTGALGAALLAARK